MRKYANNFHWNFTKIVLDTNASVHQMPLFSQTRSNKVKCNSHSCTTNCAVQWAFPLRFSAMAVYTPASDSLQCFSSSLNPPSFSSEMEQRSMSRSVSGLLSFSHVTFTSFDSRRRHSKIAFSPAEESEHGYRESSYGFGYLRK